MPLDEFLDAVFAGRFRYGIPLGAKAIVRIQSGVLGCWKCGVVTRIVTFIEVFVGPHRFQLTVAIARAAQLQQRQRSAAPGPELQRLMTVGAEQLRAGLPVDRLEFLLRHASPGRTCEKAIDSRRVVVHTPVSTGSIASASFADNRIVVTGEGTAARAADGTVAARFDPAQPVTLRFLRIDGDVATAVGRLPFAHAVVLGDAEFRFAVQASQQQPEAVELSAQRCGFP